MGDQYFISVNCPTCGIKEDQIYYAPTCGIVQHICRGCGYIFDLEEETGISYEDASNLGMI